MLWSMAQGETEGGRFAATSGGVEGLTVAVNYSPAPSLPSISGIWVARYSYPDDPSRYVTFALILVQDGRRIAGVSIEPPSVPEHRGIVALVADWIEGDVSEGGMITIVKRYRDQPRLETILYEGQVHPDMRCWGGAWSCTDIPCQGKGTFVAYKTCRLQGWGL